MKKFILLFGLIGSLALANENKNKNYDINFNPKAFTKKNFEIDGKKINYYAYENIVYVKKPIDLDYQTMNIYIPEEYFNGKNIGEFNAKNAPIFFPNSVGGYMPGKAEKDGLGRDGKANSIIYALSKGYIVAAPGARGRTLTDKNGKFTGKAPAAIVDLKAAVRYLRFNDKVMPGNAEKIISNGTSAGGALSALLGASGNSPDYLPYLKELGAADVRDDIFAVSAYCPITNLENADSAYEWTFNGVNHYKRMVFKRDTTAEQFNNRAMQHSISEGNLSEQEIEVSNKLKTLFPNYLNSLKLKDEKGNLLSLDNDGNGSFKLYLADIIKDSANKAINDGKDIKDFQDSFKIENGKVISVDYDKYIHSGDRMKAPPAFDALDASSGENNLFGTTDIDNKHFTKFSLENSAVKVEMADKNIIKMMNAMNYIDKNTSTQYWRIRHGAIDKDTALAIPTILALKLKNSNKSVDFAAPWAQGHGGDYDLDELFDWIGKVVR